MAGSLGPYLAGLVQKWQIGSNSFLAWRTCKYISISTPKNPMLPPLTDGSYKLQSLQLQNPPPSLALISKDSVFLKNKPPAITNVTPPPQPNYTNPRWPSCYNTKMHRYEYIAHSHCLLSYPNLIYLDLHITSHHITTSLVLVSAAKKYSLLFSSLPNTNKNKTILLVYNNLIPIRLSK